MKQGFIDAAYYIELENGEELSLDSFEWYGKTIQPKHSFTEIGTHKRNNFSMQEGWALVYEGSITDNVFRTLLFSSTGGVKNPEQTSFLEEKRRIYYAFRYVDSETMFLPCSENAGRVLSNTPRS